ncbi:P-type conjugative transfer protein TrbL [Thiomonas sp. X19]|uniref:P-type conjugative transfer protein TrbL n=1 Tax=Thiomonas sp. X19 TaxID=1050370 RepID=UPI000B6E86B8|nr:P-type conjugative transfer protein TrbL [Thiomonas sp. X19]SCC92985.1 P-type conjugative transfer protein TrbL [Thiomonas sp. X19]
MRKTSIKWGGVLVLLLAGATAHAAPANSAGYLDAIATNFQTASGGWMTTAQGYAFSIFTGLAGLDLAWWGIKNVLKKNDLSDFFAGMTLKVSSLAFFYTIIKEAPTWMPMILQSFTKMGQGIGGASAAAMTPSGIIGQAFSVIDKLWAAFEAQPGGILHVGSNFLLAMIVALTSVMALIGFSLVALQLLMTLIESYLVGGAGLVLLGFTGSGLTSTFGETYIGYMVSVGIKLLIIYAIAGLGGNLISNEIAYINHWMTSKKSLPPMDLLSVGTAMLIYGVMGMQVPGLAASMMNGSPSMTLGNVAGGAAGVAAGVAGAGAAAVAGYAGAVGAAQGGLNKLAGLVGAGSGGSGAAAGGIGGADKLASLGAMTGAGGGSPGGIGGSKPGARSMGSVGGAGSAPGGPAPASGAPSKGVADAGRMGNSGAGASKGTVTPNTATTGTKAQSMMTDKLTQGQLQTGPASPLSARLKQDGQSGAGASAASSGASPTAPATGGADALGAPNLPTGSGASDAGTHAGEKGDEGKSPWNVMKDGLGRAAGTKDDIARHEGGGGGIQIRIGHSE